MSNAILDLILGQSSATHAGRPCPVPGIPSGLSVFTVAAHEAERAAVGDDPGNEALADVTRAMGFTRRREYVDFHEEMRNALLDWICSGITRDDWCAVAPGHDSYAAARWGGPRSYADEAPFDPAHGGRVFCRGAVGWTPRGVSTPGELTLTVGAPGSALSEWVAGDGEAWAAMAIRERTGYMPIHDTPVIVAHGATQDDWDEMWLEHGRDGLYLPGRGVAIVPLDRGDYLVDLGFTQGPDRAAAWYDDIAHPGDAAIDRATIDRIGGERVLCLWAGETLRYVSVIRSGRWGSLDHPDLGPDAPEGEHPLDPADPLLSMTPGFKVRFGPYWADTDTDTITKEDS